MTTPRDPSHHDDPRPDPTDRDESVLGSTEGSREVDATDLEALRTALRAPVEVDPVRRARHIETAIATAVAPEGHTRTAAASPVSIGRHRRRRRRGWVGAAAVAAAVAAAFVVPWVADSATRGSTNTADRASRAAAPSQYSTDADEAVSRPAGAPATPSSTAGDSARQASKAETESAEVPIAEEAKPAATAFPSLGEFPSDAALLGSLRALDETYAAPDALSPSNREPSAGVDQSVDASASGAIASKCANLLAVGYDRVFRARLNGRSVLVTAELSPMNGTDGPRARWYLFDLVGDTCRRSPLHP
ncbi:MAG: hypothetical protein R2698_04915 [Microthrixaceae bacterium]